MILTPIAVDGREPAYRFMLTATLRTISARSLSVLTLNFA